MVFHTFLLWRANLRLSEGSDTNIYRVQDSESHDLFSKIPDLTVIQAISKYPLVMASKCRVT